MELPGSTLSIFPPARSLTHGSSHWVCPFDGEIKLHDPSEENDGDELVPSGGYLVISALVVQPHGAQSAAPTEVMSDLPSGAIAIPSCEVGPKVSCSGSPSGKRCHRRAGRGLPSDTVHPSRVRVRRVPSEIDPFAIWRPRSGTVAFGRAHNFDVLPALKWNNAAGIIFCLDCPSQRQVPIDHPAKDRSDAPCRVFQGAHRRHGCFPGLRSWLQAPDAALLSSRRRAAASACSIQVKDESWAAEDESRHQEREPPMYPRAR